MSIKYHDNTVYPQYGDDHKLTNNWNPDCDYGNEYVSVYFRIDAKGYSYPAFSFTEEDRTAFNTELAKIFNSLGWKCEEEAYSGSCATWRNKKSHLYLHPQDFSGEVLKNDIKSIAEALENNTTFKLRWVDLYETVYDITDEEYEKFLSTKDEEIKNAALEICKTKRTNKYCYMDEVVRYLSSKFRLRRIGEDEVMCGTRQIGKYIINVINSLIGEGYIVAARDNTLIRTINKTEQKQRKLFVA